MKVKSGVVEVGTGGKMVVRESGCSVTTISVDKVVGNSGMDADVRILVIIGILVMSLLILGTIDVAMVTTVLVGIGSGSAGG